MLSGADRVLVDREASCGSSSLAAHGLFMLGLIQKSRSTRGGPSTVVCDEHIVQDGEGSPGQILGHEEHRGLPIEHSDGPASAGLAMAPLD